MTVLPDLPEVLSGLARDNLEDVFFQAKRALALVEAFAAAHADAQGGLCVDEHAWYALEIMTADARKALDRAYDVLPASVINARLEAWAKESTPDLARQFRELANHTARNVGGSGPHAAPPAGVLQPEPEGA